MGHLRCGGLSRFATGLIVLGLLCGGAGRVQAGEYDFTILVEEGETFGGTVPPLISFSKMDINNNDVIRFTGLWFVAPGQKTAGIFSPNGLILGPGLPFATHTLRGR